MAKQFRAFHALHMAHTAIFSAADKSLKKQEGILTAHQVILFVLTAEDGLPSKEIAKRAGMSKSRLTGLVDALERKAFVRREQGQEDARQQLIYIEAEGRAVIDRTKGWVNKLNRSLLKTFDANEQKVIERFLSHAARFDAGYPLDE